MYLHVLKGAVPPLEYVALVMQERLGYKPWEMDEPHTRPQYLCAGDVLDAIDCWRGETRAHQAQQRTSPLHNSTVRQQPRPDF